MNTFQPEFSNSDIRHWFLPINSSEERSREEDSSGGRGNEAGGKVAIIVGAVIGGFGLRAATIACASGCVIDSWARAEAAKVIWEGGGTNVDVDVLASIVDKGGAIADIAISTFPGIGLLVLVWSHKNVTVLGQTDWVVPLRALEVRVLSIKSSALCIISSSFPVSTSLSIGAEIWGVRGAVVSIASFCARAPVMVMELVSGSRMVKADRESLNLIDDGIDVATSESIENVTT